MKWPKERIDISLIRRFIGTPKDGVFDVYQLFMELTIGKSRYDWALCIALDNIKNLQEYVNMGIEACQRNLSKDNR